MEKFLVNGEIQDKIILDEGFTFGKGLFETILVKESAIFLKEHLDRLNRGLSFLKINKKIEEDEVLKVIEKMKLKNCALKIMVSDKNTIFTSRCIPYKNEDYEKGFRISISNIKRNPYSNMTYLKSFNYYDNIIERHRAISEGYNEVLFLNVHNKIAEGSVSNIFFIKENIIYTPKVSTGILDGVTRKKLIKLIENKYCLEEGEYTLEEIINSEGIFLTNSLMGVMKVIEIENKKVKQSAIIEEIRKLYEKEIR